MKGEWAGYRIKPNPLGRLPWPESPPAPRAFLTAKGMDRQRRRHTLNKVSTLIVVSALWARSILPFLQTGLRGGAGGKARADRIRVDQY